MMYSRPAWSLNVTFKVFLPLINKKFHVTNLLSLQGVLNESCPHLHFVPPPSPQIPHLAEGVRIHGDKVTEALRPFHDRLEACFKQLREKVEKQYGAKSLVRAFFLICCFQGAFFNKRKCIFISCCLPFMKLCCRVFCPLVFPVSLYLMMPFYIKEMLFNSISSLQLMNVERET